MRVRVLLGEFFTKSEILAPAPVHSLLSRRLLYHPAPARCFSPSPHFQSLFDEGYGTVLDSGTTFTYVPTAVFQAFAKGERVRSEEAHAAASQQPCGKS